VLTSGLGVNATTASGYYAIAITASSATGYSATATGRDGTSQANDGNCRVLGVQMAAGNLTYGASANSTIDWADPNRCWAR
jgi:type IV pilus assembly protein PilE